MMIILWCVITFPLVSTFSSDVCPKECFCNKHLTSVNCEGHKLTSIPPNLPKNVETLYMGHNNLYYINLTENGLLPNLREIRLDNNKISGLKSNTFDGNSVPKLSTVYLRNNKISVVESRSFFNLSIINVYLTNNIIQQIQDDAFVNTPSVLYINLDSNSLSRIPSLGKLQQLQQLFIQANKITDPTFPVDYLRLTELNDIGLSNNLIQALGDNTFENLKNAKIRKLELSRNKINQISKSALKWFRNIISLRIGRNPLTSSSLETAFHGLVGAPLTSLNIDNVTLGGLLPSSTFQLLRNTSIRNLSMKNNKMSSIPRKGFADLKRLSSLDLSASAIFTVDDTAFEGLDALNTLFLNDNQISNIPVGLPPSLQKLYLNGNQITIIQNQIFANLTKLQWLFLGKNKITTLEKDAFKGLTRLKKLHLVWNLISTLPGKLFSPFIVLESLELNKNNIKTIPNDASLFSPMSSLLYLNMAGNELSKCPMGIFSVLNSLLYLHLENNKLGPSINNDVNGQLFAGLERLILLNLTNNEITHLPEPIFKDLRNIQNITLKINKISTWGDNLYKRTTKLKNLDLSQNLIALVNSSSVNDLQKLSSFDLRQNPFACTCDLRWFRDWMNTTTVRLIDNGSYLCNSPPEWHGKKLLSFDRTKINCVWFTTWDVILAGVGGFLVLSIITFIVYRKRWFIKLRCYRIKKSFRRTILRKGDYQLIDGEVNKYDAYISYAEDDYQWILKHLLPGVDNGSFDDKEFGGEFNLFFEGRDGVHQGGNMGFGSIIENMEASRVVLIILTKAYKSKDRYRFEIDHALGLLHSGDIMNILIVNVDGLIVSDVPKLLRRKMEKNEFIAWEDTEEAKQAFREGLLDSLRRKGECMI